MIEEVVVYHNTCGRLETATRDTDSGLVTLPGGELHDHPECGGLWSYGYDVIGQVTAHYLSEESPEVNATPPAMLLAHKLGLIPESLVGSGPGGQVTKADVEQAYIDKVRADYEAAFSPRVTLPDGSIGGSNA